MRENRPLVWAVVMLCFFVSGMAGLVYQIVWARYLGLFLGHTSYAVVAVVVAFMGGLAVGNAWLGAQADRTRRPLALYAWLEIGIGLYALIFPFYYELCYSVFVRLSQNWQPGSQALLALKFGFSFLTILLPTVLMGATFPALTKFVTRSLSELREQVAALYFINSAGAIAGVMVGDFWWVPAIGLEASVYAAAAMNLLVGLVAFYLSNRLQEGKAATAPEGMPSPTEEESYSSAELRLAVVGIGISGFVAMLYEVAWTRLLGLALGSSTHAFGLMLMTFISGITVGAWIIYRWKRLRRILQAFGWAELALAGTLFVSMFFYDLLPYWFIKLAGLLARQPEAYLLYAFFQALLSFAVMFIPTVCLGMTLPLVSRIATVEFARTGRSVGRVFAVNTIGTVLGAALTGLWLMPALGLARTFALGLGLNTLVAVMILGRAYWLRRPATLIAAPLFVALLVWGSGGLFDHSWQRVLTAGLWRASNPPVSVSEYHQRFGSDSLVYYRDGASATVNVLSSGTDFWLKVNGKTDASTLQDMTTQVLSGQIPMLIKPDAREVLVIGLGSGVTAGSVACHPNVRSLDMVEISPEVVEAARYFAAENNHVLEDPRSKIIIEDAKSFLLATARRYDVIISEPSNPWMAGVSGVFSREFYETCRDRLRPKGLMVQWVQAYESNDTALDMVVATYSAVFPYVSIWQGWLGDLLLLGTTEPLPVDLGALAARFHEASVKTNLARIKIDTVPVLLSQQIISPENGIFVPIEPSIHSDFYPALEYVAQRAFFVRRQAERWRLLDESYHPRPTTLLGEYLKRNRLTEDDFRAFEAFHFGNRFFPGRLLRSLFLRWQQEQPESQRPLAALAKLADQPSGNELELLRLAAQRDRILQIAPSDPLPLRFYGLSLMRTYREQRSVLFIPNTAELELILDKLLELDRDLRRIYTLNLAEIAWDRGDEADFVRLAQFGLDPDPAKAGPLNFRLDPHAPTAVLARMIESFWRRGQLEQAWDICRQAREGGYLSERASYRDQWLELVYRKVEAHAAQTEDDSNKSGLAAK